MKKTARLTITRTTLTKLDRVVGGRFTKSDRCVSGGCYAPSYDAGCSNSCNTCEWCETYAYTACNGGGCEVYQ
jgi:hypothetical protein